MSLDKAVELILQVEKELSEIPMDQIDDFCSVTSSLYDIVCALEFALQKQIDKDSEKLAAIARKQGV